LGSIEAHTNDREFSGVYRYLSQTNAGKSNGASLRGSFLFAQLVVLQALTVGDALA
jgi:hypothetical protein